MKLSISDVLRADIKEHIALASANRCDFAELSTAMPPIDKYSLMMSNDIRVYYIHHHLPSNQVLAHLSVHGLNGARLDDEIVEQLADEFGLGSRVTWKTIHRPLEPSTHIFKIL